jgi:Zn-dependent protease with chaperone function
MMSFIVLCVTVCLSAFLLVFLCGLTSAIALARILARLQWSKKTGPSPLLSLAIRILPLSLAFVTTLGLVLPSFLTLEPRRAVESPGAHLWVLSIAAAALICTLGFRFARLLIATSQLSRVWMDSGAEMDAGVNVPVYRLDIREPLVAMTGILRPRIFVSKQALEVLSPRELRAALDHEIPHVRRFDNLAQLVLSATRMPKWFASLRNFESGWMSSVEFRADESAIMIGTSALDLASALVKLARLRQMPARESLVGVCHLIPESSPSAVALRVQRLHCLVEKSELLPKRQNPAFWIANAVMVAVAYSVLLPSTLSAVQRMIEILVR